jgi:hypothetical protein
MPNGKFWSGLRIWIQFWIQGLMTKNWKKLKAEFFYFLSICNLLIPRPLKKDAQAQAKPSAQKKRTSSNSKHEISLLFFCGSFLPSWIQIQQLKLMRIRWFWLYITTCHGHCGGEGTSVTPPHIFSHNMNSYRNTMWSKLSLIQLNCWSSLFAQ